MKNYRLMAYLDKHPQHLGSNTEKAALLEALIKVTACFSVILEDFIRKPSLFDYDRIIEEWKNGQLSSKSARQYAFMELYVEAIDMANAIGFMVDNSLHKAGFILWRVLYERLVICKFIFEYDSTCLPLSQNYVVDLTRFSGQLISFRERSPKWEEKDHIHQHFVSKWSRWCPSLLG